MGKRPRHKMPISERAKQFAPFAAIRGLEEALRKKEEEMKQKEKPKNENELPDISFPEK